MASRDSGTARSAITLRPGFLTLPFELRLSIYERTFTCAAEVIPMTKPSGQASIGRRPFSLDPGALALLQACKQVAEEATRVLYGTNHFHFSEGEGKHCACQERSRLDHSAWSYTKRSRDPWTERCSTCSGTLAAASEAELDASYGSIEAINSWLLDIGQRNRRLISRLEIGLCQDTHKWACAAGEQDSQFFDFL